MTQTAGGEYGEEWFSFEMRSFGTADDRLTLSYEHDYSKRYLNFELYDADGTRLTGATGSIGEKSISLKKRAAGTYYVRVYPYRGGAVPYALTVETATTAPNAPKRLRVDALNAAEKKAVLTWDAVDGETGYVVESSLDGTTWTTLGIAEANATTFDVSDEEAGVKYRARVVGEFKYSDWTETSLTVVTTALDAVDATDGVLSLREALESAEVGATVAFDSTVFAEKTTIERNGTFVVQRACARRAGSGAYSRREGGEPYY